MAKKTYIIYDARAVLQGTENAVVLDTAESLAEAEQTVREDFPDGVIYEYDLVGDKLLHERGPLAQELRPKPKRNSK